MHKSAYDSMKRLVTDYVPAETDLAVVELGSRMVAKQPKNHRSLFDERFCDYLGLDVADGPNVDVVMEQPYRIPLDDECADVVVSGQVVEHIPFVWVSFLEMTRILRPGGRILMSGPSSGHIHSPPYDAWRFYPDSFRALAAFATLELLEVSTDFPKKDEKGRFDYGNVPFGKYWGDTVGVFEKTELYDLVGLAAVREPMVAWANAHADLGATPEPSDPQPLLPKALSALKGSRAGQLLSRSQNR